MSKLPLKKCKPAQDVRIFGVVGSVEAKQSSSAPQFPQNSCDDMREDRELSSSPDTSALCCMVPVARVFTARAFFADFKWSMNRVA